MADETVASEQVESTPEPAEAAVAEGQAVEAFIEFGGEKLPASEVQKRLTQGAEATKEMQTLHRERSDLQGKLEGYQKWADPIQERYNTNPEFQQGIDALDWGGPTTAPVSRENQRLNELEMDNAINKQDREFDRMRVEGFEISKENESAILHEIAVNNRNTPTVEAAYRKLFWERDMKSATQGATTQTAEAMAQNQGAYETPPAGAVPAGTPDAGVKELKNKNPDAWRDAAVADIKALGFKTDWD